MIVTDVAECHSRAVNLTNQPGESALILKNFPVRLRGRRCINVETEGIVRFDKNSHGAIPRTARLT